MDRSGSRSPAPGPATASGMCSWATGSVLDGALPVPPHHHHHVLLLTSPAATALLRARLHVTVKDMASATAAAAASPAVLYRQVHITV